MQIIKKIFKSVVNEFQLKNFGFEYNNVEEFYKSQWQHSERSVIYLIFRWIWALFFLGIFIASLVLQFSDGKLFIFLTNWGIMLCLATHMIAAILTTCWHFNWSNVRDMALNEHEEKTRTNFILKCYWLLHGVTLSLAFVITTIYWLFLHGKMNKPTRFPTMSFITHCLNSVFMLVDFLIVAFPVRLLHTIYAMLLPICYCIFSVVYYFCGGTDEYNNHYIYPILDWKTPLRGIKTFAGVFCLYVVFAILIFVIFKLKRSICRALRVVWIPQNAGLI